jgi:hypothetical protein
MKIGVSKPYGDHDPSWTKGLRLLSPGLWPNELTGITFFPQLKKITIFEKQRFSAVFPVWYGSCFFNAYQ